MEKHNFLYKNAYIYSNIHSFENYIKFLDESVVNNFFNENKKDVLCYYLHR